MREQIRNAASVLELTRVTGAFSAVANVWFVVLWTRSFAGRGENGPAEALRDPAWIPLAGAALTALGLYAFGATLNDVVDAKRDRTLRPSRPLASERLSIELALGLTVGTVLAAVLGSLLLGPAATVMTVVVAVAITGYNVLGRFVPAIGAPLLSVAYAGHMLVPNVDLAFTWPVLLVLSHALVIGLVSHVVEHRVPRLSLRAIVFAAVGWAGCAAVLVWRGPADGMGGSLWPEWVPLGTLVWVGAAAAALALVCGRRIARLGRGARAAAKVKRYGTLWPAIYACAWMIGAGRLGDAWPLLALTAAGVAGMTILREAYALIEEPIEFRWQ